MKKDNKQVAIIERGEDGRYSVYIENKNYPYGIIGTGATVKAAMADFLAGYEEMKECVESTGETFVEAEFIFKYDIPSFLQEYAFAFSLAGLERITGVNQKQLGHYISGYRKPSDKTIRKIESGIHAFSEQLSAVRFL
ncbi:MAG: helix-turn-helix transcriptional regulator [Bacteroidales bacterium]|nr:helix-turn-helix transcriptional regulator [Bacteroidales bacterium]